MMTSASALMSDLQASSAGVWIVSGRTAGLRLLRRRVTLKSLNQIRVSVRGMPYWNPVLAEQLRGMGLLAEVPEERPSTSRLRGWIDTAREAVRYDVIHVLFPSMASNFHVVARLMGAHVIYHWIGSDVLSLTQAPAHDVRRRVRGLLRYGSGFLAVSQQLADELQGFGITCRVAALLPRRIWGPLMPLPRDFSVLCYMGNDPEVYGADLILKLAEEFSEVPFFITGNGALGLRTPTNVKLLGRVEDIEAVYRQCTVLVRLNRHDGFPAMVPEALMRGRYVIYNRPHPETLCALDYRSASDALRYLKSVAAPNIAGRDYVMANYNPRREAEKILQVYREAGV